MTSFYLERFKPLYSQANSCAGMKTSSLRERGRITGWDEVSPMLGDLVSDNDCSDLMNTCYVLGTH